MNINEYKAEAIKKFREKFVCYRRDCCDGEYLNNTESTPRSKPIEEFISSLIDTTILKLQKYHSEDK